jgi:hypothetical protein
MGRCATRFGFVAMRPTHPKDSQNFKFLFADNAVVGGKDQRCAREKRNQKTITNCQEVAPKADLVLVPGFVVGVLSGAPPLTHHAGSAASALSRSVDQTYSNELLKITTGAMLR